MPINIFIASADPLIASALAEQLAEAGFACEKDAEIAVLDPDHPLPVATKRVLTLQKPVKRAELIARLKQLAETSGPLPVAAGWVLHAAERKLANAENAVQLTEKEAQLLVCLLAAPSRCVTRQKLLEDVWGYKRDTDTHTLETHLHRLRAKLKDIGGEGWIVATEEGYRISA